MVQDKQIEKLEQSARKLTITVGKEELKRQYDQLITKYAKSAQIPGFRKGKVPANILERKFGESLRAETLGNVVEEALRESFETLEEKPLPYSHPELVEELDHERGLDEDLTFAVTFDVYPEVQIGAYDKLTVKEAVIPVTDEDVARELEKMRQQNALVVDKEDGAVAEGNVVTVSFFEVGEDGNPVAGTERQDVTMTVGESHNVYHIDEELVGMAKGETKVFTKEYAEDFEHPELAGKTKQVSFHVSAIKERDVPELDDDFAQDVSDDFETLDDLKADVRSRLEKNAAAAVRNRSVEQIMEHVVAATTLELPRTMIAMELESAWRNLLQQYRATDEQLRALLQMQGQTREQLFEQWTPDAQRRLTRTLVVQKLIELEKIEVSDEDAEAEVRREAEERKADATQILEYYKSHNMLDYVKQELAERTLFDGLLGRATIEPGETIAYVDALGQNG